MIECHHNDDRRGNLDRELCAPAPRSDAVKMSPMLPAPHSADRIRVSVAERLQIFLSSGCALFN
jgi:hypothetical protein